MGTGENGFARGVEKGRYVFNAGDVFCSFKVLGCSVSSAFTHIVDEVFGYFA